VVDLVEDDRECLEPEVEDCQWGRERLAKSSKATREKALTRRPGQCTSWPRAPRLEAELEQARKVFGCETDHRLAFCGVELGLGLEERVARKATQPFRAAKKDGASERLGQEKGEGGR
jgi:hypothetical protein